LPGPFLPPSINTGAATIQVAAADQAILALDPNAFTVTHKDTNGSDFRTTTISCFEESGAKRFRLDSTFDGSTTRHEQTRPQPGTYVMEIGKVVSNDFQPLRREILVRTEPDPASASSWKPSSNVPTSPPPNGPKSRKNKPYGKTKSMAG
jgi:hypothetical protein